MESSRHAGRRPDSNVGLGGASACMSITFAIFQQARESLWL